MQNQSVNTPAPNFGVTKKTEKGVDIFTIKVPSDDKLKAEHFTAFIYSDIYKKHYMYTEVQHILLEPFLQQNLYLAEDELRRFNDLLDFLDKMVAASFGTMKPIDLDEWFGF